MDAARQIIRFSIPGSLLLLHAIACYFIYRRCQGVPFAAASEPLKENIGAVVAVLSAIPIGFVIFQAYYHSYAPVVRPLPWLPWRGRFVRADRGARILGSLEPSQIDSLQRIFGTKINVGEPYEQVARPEGNWYREPVRRVEAWFHMLELTPELTKIKSLKDRRKAYENQWYGNWDVLRAILDISGSISGAAQVKAEYTALSDIYHSLGAARTAVVWGWGLILLLAVTHAGRLISDPFGTLAGIVLISALTAVIYFVLHSARRRTWKSASSSLRLGLRWVFWRYTPEFVPEQPNLAGKRGRRALQRALAGRRLEKAASELPDNVTILENLQALAMRGVSDLGSLISGGGEDDEEPELAGHYPSDTRAGSSASSGRFAPLAAFALGGAAAVLAWRVLDEPGPICLAVLAAGAVVAVLLAASGHGGDR